MKKTSSIILVMLMLSMLLLSVSIPVRASSANIWTDKEDYSPEETVTIYGSGFNPNAIVSINVTRPDNNSDEWIVTSDSSGSFTTTYLLDGILGVYTVVATDGTNTATTTFTDADIDYVSVSPSTQTITAGDSTTYTVTVAKKGGSELSVTLSVVGSLPSGSTSSFSLNPVTFSSSESGSKTSTLTIITSASGSTGTFTFKVRGTKTGTGDKADSTDVTLIVQAPLPPAEVSTTITSSPVTGSGFVKVDGVAYDTPAYFSWTPGSTHTLEALSPVAGPTGTQYVWMSWSDGGAQTHNIVTPSTATTYTANYKTQYYLTVVSPYGTPGGMGWYDAGTTAYATVTPLIVPGPAGTQYVFTHWSDDASGTTSPSDPITMDGPKTATANWKTQYQITFTADPSEALGGTFKVTYTQCGTTYTEVEKTTTWTEWVDAGTTVTVSDPQEYVPSEAGVGGIRYKFDRYDPLASVTMNEAKTITLVYKTQYYLTVKTDPSDIVTVPGEGWYDKCTNVGLTAPSAPKYYRFDYWNVDGTSQGTGVRAITVHMDGPHTATAHYTKLVTRTQGFWATHKTFTWSKWTTETIGTKIIDTDEKLFGAFWSNVATTSTGAKRSLLDQAKMQLLQQLVAAMLNIKAFGDDDLGTGAGLIAAGKAAFSGTDRTAILSIANQLAAFNNSGDNQPLPPGVTPGPADPQGAQKIADRGFWNTLP
ncbi:MAG: hypothetical protein H3Z50_05290 [archaeon]|nr:hypothetical protein [archaeon]